MDFYIFSEVLAVWKGGKLETCSMFAQYRLKSVFLADGLL